MTNDHIINNDMINNNNIIYISYDHDFKSLNIKLDKNKRYIKSFIDEGLDITVIEIKDVDNISKDFCLKPELEIVINKKLNNAQINIPQYIGQKELKNARGTIKNINKYEFTHLVNTLNGSSGSPVFLENSRKVIGIHKSGHKSRKENFGDFIYPAINIITEDIRKIRNNGKYINGKYIYDDGRYYIGKFNNNIPNGKGILYYSNGKIKYEGDFINGKFEGIGRYNMENGDYYIGQWKNNLKNGKGIEYYSNGNIKYEGNFINGEMEGYSLINDDKYNIEILPSDFQKSDKMFKIIMVGDSGVGKRCLSIRAVKNTFSHSHFPHIGMDFLIFKLRINNIVLKLQIWHSSNEIEKYKNLLFSYYKDASLALLLYAINDSDSFEHTKTYLKNLRKLASKNMRVILVGTKSDLQVGRIIPKEKGEKLKKKEKLDKFIEISSRTGENVKQLFVEAAKLLYEDDLEGKNINLLAK